MKKALILLMATAVALIMPYVFSMRAPSMAQAPWKSFAQEPGRYLAPTIVPKNVPVQNKTLVATLNNTIQTLQHIKKESDVSKVALEKNITELERELEKLDKITPKFLKKPREASLYNSLSCLIEYLDQLIRSITDPCRGYRSILGKRGVEGFKEIKKMAEIEATLSLRMTLYSKNNLETEIKFIKRHIEAILRNMKLIQIKKTSNSFIYCHYVSIHRLYNIFNTILVILATNEYI